MFAKPFRILTLSLVLVTLLFVGASHAHAADQDVTLAGREFFPGKGLVFYFQVDKNYDVDGAAKYVIIDGVQYELTCRLREDGLLACLADAPRSVIGKEAEIHFGAFLFNTIIPEAHTPPGGTEYCYPVFDFTESWEQVGTHCQGSPASPGEQIEFNSFSYYFEPNGPAGEGYYPPLG